VKETLLKAFVRRMLFPNGSIRKIRFGPLAGCVYRVSDITGMSAWYSGPERAHQRVFESLIRDGDIVMDVGANWGMHTIFLSRRVGEKGHVIAVEPEPRALSELEWHLQANECQNVTVHRCALADHAGVAAFVTGESAYTGHLATKEGNCDDMHVAATTLDTLISEEGIHRLNLVKIDVEGAETVVLAGGAKTLAEIKPYFVIDLHTPEQDVAVARVLSDAGYDIRRLDGSVIKYLDQGWPHPEGVWGSIVARPLSC
jgi:FkbM family methyltransferase